MGEGLHLGNIHVSLNIDAFGLLGKDDRYIKMSGSHAGDTDTGSLDGQDLVDRLVCKAAFPLGAHLVKETDIHLVVEKAVHLEHLVVSPDLSVPLNPLLQCFHKKRPFPHGF